MAGGSRARNTARLFDQGIAIVATTYRFSHEACYPATIHDCKLAVRWVRAHADRFGLDTERIAVWGISAGGHLVALMGVTNGNPDYEGDGPFADQSSRVCCVCDVCGPTDFPRVATDPVPGETMIDLCSRLFGDPIDQQHDLAIHASPLHQAHSDAAPHLIIHGEADPIVPVYHATSYHDRLRELNVPSDLIVNPGVGHNVQDVAENAPRIVAFFRKHLAAD